MHQEQAATRVLVRLLDSHLICCVLILRRLVLRCFLSWQGQVVSVKIPPSKLPEFSKAYFDMFVKYDNGAGRIFMDRRDPQVKTVDDPLFLLLLLPHATGNCPS